MYVDPLRVEIKSDSRKGGGRTLQYDLLPLDGAETYTLGLEDIFTIFFFFFKCEKHCVLNPSMHLFFISTSFQTFRDECH